MAAEFQDVGGKRFYWDGRTYAGPAEAQEAAEAYAADGFEVQVVETEEGSLVYNRREVSSTS
jgi:hypothetical protein